MKRLSRRDRRAIVLGLWVLAPVMVAVLGLRPFSEWMAHSRDKLAGQQALLARERGLVEDRPGLDQRRLGLDSALEARLPRLFDGDPTVAVGALTRHVYEAAGSSRFHLATAVPIEATHINAGVYTIGLRVRGISDIVGVLEFIRRVEDGERLIRFEELTLRRGGQGALTPRSGGEEVTVVSLDATLAGYVVRQGPDGQE